MTTLRERRNGGTEERYTLTDFAQWISAGNGRFPTQTYSGSPAETIGDDFVSYIQSVYKRNGIVFACMVLRQAIFAEAIFRFAAVNNGKIGTLFGTPELDLLERPFGPTSSTGDLATRMIQDADLAGNFYAVARDSRLWRRRPDKMSIVLDGDPAEDEFVSVAGFAYYPAGILPGAQFHTYLPDEVCHWTPLPDPDAEYRGMSWLTPVLREIRSDGAATDHKLEFFDNAATPNMVVKTPESVMTNEQFEAFKQKMDSSHVGRGNRHKTLYLVPGADVEVVGGTFQQMEFSEIQGRDEDRIASAAGVPAVLVGLKESLQGSSLNTGNFGQARRRFADGTMRPLYRSAASALANIVRPPQNRGPSVLWYDDSQVAFFREDRKDAAEIDQVQQTTITGYVNAGFTHESAVKATTSSDPSLLVHSGLYSVQLQPAGTVTPPAA